MKKRMLFTALVLTVVTAFGLTGCGERADDTKVTEVVTETEAITEVITEAPTEKPTEPPTEAPTEKPTEPPTEVVVETEAPETEAPANLTADEEVERYTEFTSETVYYATDDMNIRETPSTENSDNIIASYDQGEEIIAVGETPNWLKVRVGDWSGYVFKGAVSETVVEPKSEEERARIMEEAGYTTSGEEGEESAGSSGVNQNVQPFQDSFTVQLSGNANLRTAPSDQANIIGTVSEGSIVTATGEADDWYEVNVDGTVGYISKKLVG